MKAASTNFHVILTFLLIFLGKILYAQPISDFTSSDESWAAVGKCPAESAPTVNWSSTGGNPGGYIYATDESVGAFYWVGNGAEWKGNMSAYYGCYLLFDLKTNNTSFPFSDYDVAIISNDDSVLTYNATPNPSTSWSSYVIPLTAGSWIVDGKLTASECPDLSGTLATAADMINYLSTLKKFRIRAEFSGLSYEMNSMDNILIDCEIMLPIEMLSFTGKQIGSQLSKLTWVTATETDCDGFVIQKSTNGIVFDSIGFVYGNGTTTDEHTYDFVDDNFNTTSYYRLKQLDYNGKFEYSNIISIASAIQFEAVTLIFPNPATNVLNVAGAFPVASVRIMNLNGDMIYEEPMTEDPVFFNRSISLENLPSGIYSITVIGKYDSETYLFEIIR